MTEDEKLPDDDEKLEQIEVKLLLEAVYRRYGYDFRHYAYPSMRRRIRHRTALEKLETISLLTDRVLRDRELFERLLADLVIPVTELFRNPGMFRMLRERIVPLWKDDPYLRVWHAGCATGEEAYSMSILLREAGMLGQSRIYATDISQKALQRAREAFLPQERLALYERNYEEAGGRSGLESHWTRTECGGAALLPAVTERIVFAEHNLVTDRSFNEFNLIFCRNVMIYFDPELRERVHALLYESLAEGGFLVLGGKESVKFTKFASRYETWSDEFRIYRKIR